jgi:AcrR family transcriptional regulator
LYDDCLRSADRGEALQAFAEKRCPSSPADSRSPRCRRSCRMLRAKTRASAAIWAIPVMSRQAGKAGEARILDEAGPGLGDTRGKPTPPKPKSAIVEGCKNRASAMSAKSSRIEAQAPEGEITQEVKRRTRARKKARISSSPRPYAGRGPEQRKQDRRERLLDAGLDLFGSIGYAQTSIERLCARAGVTTRHFYEEFGSREALLKAVYDFVIARTTEAVREAILAGAPQDRLVGLEAFLDAYLIDPRYGRIGSIEIVGVSPELELHRRAVIHSFADIIETQYRRRAPAGNGDSRSFRLAAIAMTGAVNELCIEALMDAQPPPLGALKAELGRMFIGLFRSAEEGA